MSTKDKIGSELFSELFSLWECNWLKLLKQVSQGHVLKKRVEQVYPVDNLIKDSDHILAHISPKSNTPFLYNDKVCEINYQALTNSNQPFHTDSNVVDIKQNDGLSFSSNICLPDLFSTQTICFQNNAYSEHMGVSIELFVPNHGDMLFVPHLHRQFIDIIEPRFIQPDNVQNFIHDPGSIKLLNISLKSSYGVWERISTYFLKRINTLFGFLISIVQIWRDQLKLLKVYDYGFFTSLVYDYGKLTHSHTDIMFLISKSKWIMRLLMCLIVASGVSPQSTHIILNCYKRSFNKASADTGHTVSYLIFPDEIPEHALHAVIWYHSLMMAGILSFIIGHILHIIPPAGEMYPGWVTA